MTNLNSMGVFAQAHQHFQQIRHLSMKESLMNDRNRNELIAFCRAMALVLVPNLHWPRLRSIRI